MPALLRRRECLVPTWRGWLVAGVMLALAGFAFVRGIFPWLAVQDSIPGGVLVAEGWAPDYALTRVIEEFRAQPYSGIYVTGIPMEKGGVLSEYGTFAELSAATLVRLGADPQTVHAVSSPEVRKDRTYATAVALREWLRVHQVPSDRVNVVSVGAHSRRTRLLFEKAFGPDTRVGIIAIPHRDFDSAQWWRSSQGFRIVTGEVIAYAYARLLFRAEP